MLIKYICFAVPVRANKDIWILGDVFVTEAIAILMEMQNLKHDELYLFSGYDPQPYYPSLLSKETFGRQIVKQLFTALEEHNKLPSIILIVLGNKQIDNMVMNPEQTRRIWNALFTEIQRILRIRKEDLPKKAKSLNEPRILITNLFPRYREYNEKLDHSHETFKTKRRRLNGMLPQLASSYEYTVLPVTGILPDQTDFFSMSTGQLNGRGIQEFWSIVSKAVKLNDVRCEEKQKNHIIQEYFEQEREQRKINQERNKIRKDRCSLPRTNSHGNVTNRNPDRRSKILPAKRSSSVPTKDNSQNRSSSRNR